MGKYCKKDLIIYFLTDNKSGHKTKEKHILKQFDGLIDEINNDNKNSEFDLTIPFTQKLYNFLYNIKEIPKCETCGKEIKWKNRFTEGYLKNCSKNCRSKSVKRLERIEKTNIKKYGVKSISQVSEFNEKRKRSFLKKYGSENIFKSDIIKEKSKQTNIKKYGVEHPIQSNDIKQKRVENNIKKYGVKSPSQLSNVKEKTKHTNIEKYGVESVMHDDTIKNKNIEARTKDTIEKYKKYLGDHVEIKYVNGKILVKNQCDIHKEYSIDKTLFYYRTLVYRHENPCIHCNPVNENNSIKEKELNDFIINDLNLETDKIKIDNMECDVFIKKYNFGIEFNGLRWHSELYKEHNYHLNKTNLFNNNAIDVIHIFEDEWTYKKDIVKSLIKNKIGLTENKIYARKCEIKEIDNKTCEEFLIKNHLQGTKKSKVRLGLFYNDILVSVMTFSKEYRAGKQERDYELDRFCNKINTNIIGGASKLFKFFIKNYEPTKIITFADKRYSNGDLYYKLGFTHSYDTKPNYWYFKRADGIRYHRFNYRKSKLIKEGYDSSKTEHDIMLERGYLRIYDCGNMKFEMGF